MQTHDEEPTPWIQDEAVRRQPPPQAGKTVVLPLVIADLEARSAVGVKEYGQPLTADNGRDGLLDAYQEICDLLVYLKQAHLQHQHIWSTLAEVVTLLCGIKRTDGWDVCRDTLQQVIKLLDALAIECGHPL